MKVTDSIMEIASDAWDDAGSNDVETCLKAALEAVFDQFPDATKMVESKVIKDFVDKMEKEIAISQKYSNYYNVNWHDAFRFIQANSEYQALKASISPVSKDKVHTISAKDMPPQSHWQPTDTQDNDGWILTHGKKPDLSDDTLVAALLRGEDKDSGVQPIKDWYWLFAGEGFCDIGDIIAYRIIEEPKEQKKEVCGCKIPARCWGGLEGLCGVCRKPLEKKDSKEENKEPKKQTLLEYVTKKYKFDHEVDAPFHRLLVVISDYLEEQNKCK